MAPAIEVNKKTMTNWVNEKSGIKMMKRNNWIPNILLALLISMLTVSVAVASALTQPKADGLIGEQANGYLGLVKQDVPGDIRKLVSDINAKRKAGYQKIASRQQGANLSDVEKVGGNKAFEKTLKGNYLRDANGVWHKK
jgi:uncharacterized protein YdbL (DUF1318 family)